MRDEVYVSVRELIDDYQLHTWMKVTLAPLEAIFPIRYTDLARFQIAGSCMPPVSRSITPATPARVVLDTGLDDYRERLVYAHEIGHGLAGHAGYLEIASLDRWFADKAEREAWEVAAVLLVPQGAITRYRDRYVIALMCDVPEFVVSLACRSYWGG
ncbi:MAG: ImmA/IrrE family metallo-endopeptidase [Thermomicrobiales bacterium]